MIGYKLRKSNSKPKSQSNSFKAPKPNQKYLKNSDLVRYIDTYLIKSKYKALPKLGAKEQNTLPIKLIKPIHTLRAPFQPSNQSEDVFHKLLNNHKRKTPVFSDMKKTYYKAHRRNLGAGKSEDDKLLIYIQGIADHRPKSVLLNKKVSFVMQTDEKFIEDNLIEYS
jgi:hypothetical protein